MFWLFVAWTGAVVVVSMVVSMVTAGNPLPGVWGSGTGTRRTGGGLPAVHKPAFAGRTP